MATFSNFKSTLVAAADTAAGASSAATTVVADMAALIALTGMSDGDQAFVTANNNLYFYSSGWYKIATVSNDSPSSITGVSGSYQLEIDGTATTITAASTDPEGFPLTWTYSTSGLGNIATVSNVDNVFTITPSTDEANAGTFTLTINATDGINGAVSASSTLTLNFILIITNSNYTTRLITAVDTSDNNNITDASSNNYAVTSNGDATAGTFSPYRHGGYSTYFPNTTNHFLEASGSTFLPSGTNSDWTVECWVNLENLSNSGVFQVGGGTNSTGHLSIHVYQGYIGSTLYSGSAIGRSTATTPANVQITTNEWMHIAVVKYNNTISLYGNGLLAESTSDTNDYSGFTYFWVGRYYSGSYCMQGVLKDLRVSQTARYTANFTPPTEALTSDSDTILLMCQDGRPYDYVSPNSYTIAQTGSISVKPYSPYDNVKYNASDHGGSVYFDGAGSSYLEASLGNDGVFTGDFTFECWFNTATTSVSYQAILYQSGGSSANGVWGIDLGSGAQLRFFYGNSSSVANTSVASGITISTNIWYHVAVVRSGSTVTMYCNGISVSSFTNSDTSGSSSWGTTVGRNKYSSSRDFQGYIADVRLTNGTAVYTANFTPPTSPLSSSGAIFHVIGTDASIIDKAQGTNLIIPSSGVSGSTTQVKFASTKSIYFTGGSSAGVDLGTNLFLDALNTEYTLEMWYYPTQTGSQSFLMSSYISSSTGRWMLHQQADSRIRFFGNLNGTREIFTTAVSANNWYHVAVVRKSNGYMSIFLNGTETELAVDLNGYATVLDRPVLLGSGDTFNSGGCQGYIQDVRITKGLARYTSSFTPPTSELQG